MKKTYEKPELNIVSYVSSGALCINCDISDPADIEFIFSGWEITSSSFAMTEPCEAPIDYDDYCKFTSADTGMKVFTS